MSIEILIIFRVTTFVHSNRCFLLKWVEEVTNNLWNKRPNPLKLHESTLIFQRNQVKVRKKENFAIEVV